MTQMPIASAALAEATVPAPEPPKSVTLDASGDERLAQLHAMFFDLTAQSKDINEKLNAVKDSIKAELTSQVTDGVTRVELRSPSGAPLRMAQSERWTVDSKKLKAEAPETYVRFARKSVSWSLVAVPGGASE